MFSQSEKQMIDAGIKKSTVKRIFKKFDGDLKLAIEKWAENGSGKLSKKFTKSAEKLGFEKSYLNNKLKEARNVRLKLIASGVQGFAEGYSNSINNSNDNSTIPAYTSPNYSLPNVNNTYNVNSNPSYSLPNVNNTYNVNSNPSYSLPNNNFNSNQSSSELYSTNQYGGIEKTGEVNSNILGDGYDVYGKNQYGGIEKTGEINKNILGDGYDVYEKNQYGTMVKVGEVKEIPKIK